MLTYEHYSESYRTRKLRAEMLRDEYPIGCRVELTQMDADPAPISSGSRGIVKCVDDMGTVHVIWDDGRQFGVIPGIDTFRRLTHTECREERKQKKY